MSDEPNKEYWPVAKLQNWDKNPRNISTEGFERLKKQIQKLGQYKPLLITPDGTVIGGNMRLRAYRDLGVSEVWVSVVEPKSESEKLEFALSDNDRAGYYDDDLLANLTAEMPDFNWEDYSVDLKEPTNLGDLLDQFKEVVEDEVPEVSDEPAVSKLGEVYQLGRHRLMCGDSTKIEDVEKLMNGQKADMVFTDPPYGMDLDAEGFDNMPTAKGTTHKSYANVIGDADDFNADFITTIFELFGYCKEIFLWGADYYSDLIDNRKSGSWIVWDKRQEGGTDKLFGSSFELCWSKNKHKRDIARILWAGYFGMSGEDSKTRIHPTQKPIQLVDWFFKRWGDGLNTVVDLFGGSGSTLIACEQTNRTCYMMELDPKYCDVIRKRYSKFIGKEESWQKETPLNQ